jgi:hypothetical protein
MFEADKHSDPGAVIRWEIFCGESGFSDNNLMIGFFFAEPAKTFPVGNQS